jgi:ABC-type dipeptide/oligopeptide/nickel transport system permease component
VQAIILLMSVTYVLVNLAIDLSYLWLDPRIRY